MHPSTAAILRHFTYDHLPTQLAEVSRDLAHKLADRFEGAELTTALRKLLEAKDCAVRAAIDTDRQRALGGAGQ